MSLLLVVGLPEPTPPSTQSFTSTGRIRSGTTYHYKTLSQIEREKAAAKARKRIVRRIEAVTPRPAAFMALWDEQITALTEDSLSADQWNAERARIDQMIWSAIRQAERADEDDSMLLLMAAM